MKNVKYLLLIVMIAISMICVVGCDGNLDGDAIEGVYVLPRDNDKHVVKESQYVAIIGNKMTLYENKNIEVYNVKKRGGKYTATLGEVTIDMMLEGNKLTLNNNGKTTEYMRDNEYKIVKSYEKSPAPVFEPKTVI